MSDFSGEQVAEATLDDDYTKPRGWRHTATWTYLVMLIASAVALVVSFVLSAETLKLARNPGQKLSCDVNAVMSCSTVAESWQAEVVKFAGFEFPECVLRHRRGISVRNDRGDRFDEGRRAPLVCVVHMAGWIGRAGLFVLADLAVVVCDQRAMPVVSVPDVLHHRAVHGVVSCHGGGSGDSGQARGRTHLLPS